MIVCAYGQASVYAKTTSNSRFKVVIPQKKLPFAGMPAISICLPGKGFFQCEFIAYVDFKQGKKQQLHSQAALVNEVLDFWPVDQQMFQCLFP